MYGVWLHNVNNRSAIIPKDQPVVADGKLKLGNGKDTWDDLAEIGASSPETSGLSVVIPRVGQQGGAYKEFSPFPSGGQVEFVEEDIYQPGVLDYPIVALDDSGNIVVQETGQYRVDLMFEVNVRPVSDTYVAIYLIDYVSGSIMISSAVKIPSAGSEAIGTFSATKAMLEAGIPSFYGFGTGAWGPEVRTLAFEKDQKFAIRLETSVPCGGWMEVDLMPQMLFR